MFLQATVADFTLQLISSNIGSTGSIPVIPRSIGANPVPVIFISFCVADAVLWNTNSNSGEPPIVSSNVVEVFAPICANVPSNKFLFNYEALNLPVRSNTLL